MINCVIIRSIKKKLFIVQFYLQKEKKTLKYIYIYIYIKVNIFLFYLFFIINLCVLTWTYRNCYSLRKFCKLFLNM